MAYNSRFLRINHTHDLGNIILVFAVEDCEFLLHMERLFFIRTFKNCWKHFDELYKVRVNVGSP